MTSPGMQFLVIGAGAMGCLFAARLKRAGLEVGLYDKGAQRAQRIRAEGIEVQEVGGSFRVAVPVVSRKPDPGPDAVLLCVKSHDTAEASKTVAPWLKEDTVILTLQNGLGNIEILEKFFGRERVLGGVTSEGATVLGHGRIRHAGGGETAIGPSGVGTKKILSAFRQAGFTCKAVDNLQQLIWGKLIINVGINALAAVTGLKNGRLPEIRSTRAIMEMAVEEAVAVARAKEIVLPYPDPIGRVRQVCKATADNVASMLQDVLNKKRTEIAVINGAIVREGEALGIATPVNAVLTSLVKAIQKTYGERL
ncbi:MAG: 2-dehydropantoate 2-reductase [Deltaproteobacteria bacterium]|nr:2-dehydropantoate 2-reductase [Deltaproteobacteria bacterium]